jgi:hypothetical protein
MGLDSRLRGKDEGVGFTLKRAPGNEEDLSTFYSNESAHNCLEEQGLIL